MPQVPLFSPADLPVSDFAMRLDRTQPAGSTQIATMAIMKDRSRFSIANLSRYRIGLSCCAEADSDEPVSSVHAE